MGQSERHDQVYDTDIRLKEGPELAQAGFDVPAAEDWEERKAFERFSGRTAVEPAAQTEPVALQEIQGIY